MFNEEKKAIFLKGSVQLPLKVGVRAIIYQTSGPIWTSAVEVIHQLSEDLIVFETRNSTYCVATKQTPEPMVLNVQQALCA